MILNQEPWQNRNFNLVIMLNTICRSDFVIPIDNERTPVSVNADKHTKIKRSHPSPKDCDIVMGIMADRIATAKHRKSTFVKKSATVSCGTYLLV